MKIKNKDEMLVRDLGAVVVETRGEGDAAVKTVRVSVSSEEPYFRDWMWDAVNNKAISGFEVLGHADGEIDFSRCQGGLVIQDTHRGDQVGLIRKPEVTDGKLGGVVEFCHGTRAQEIMADALDGLRKNMSVGYFVQEYRLVGEKDGQPVYRAVKWTPYEGSFVNVPADTSVGVGRSVNEPAAIPAVEKQKGVSIMEKPEVKAGLTADQVVECFRLAKSGNVEHGEVKELIESGKEFGEIREALEAKVEAYVKELAVKAAKPQPVAAPVAPSAELKKECAKRYSIHNVLRALAGDTTVDIAFEREVSKELGSGRAVQGVVIPDFVRSLRDDPVIADTVGRPAHGVIDGIGGDVNKLIETKLLAGQFIEALRDALTLREKCGAGVITGLVGNIAIPKAGDRPTAAWITTENGDATKTTMSFGQISATPHALGAWIDLTRQALMQASIDLQMYAQKELVYALAWALEAAAVNGTNSDGQPKGLVSTILGDNTKAWSNKPTFDKLIELIALLKKNNSANPSMRFFGDTDVWQKLATTRDFDVLQNVAGSENVAAIGGATRLLDPATNVVLGRQYVESHNAPAKKLIYGDFSQLTFCLWSGVDMIVDQYSNSTKGALRIVALQDADILIKRPEAFAMATGVHA